MSAPPRSSVFTFESTVHSCQVLRRLDEQRRSDVLCDVTVLVEGHSFRAHRSVLASCGDYFALRISSLSQHGAVITLPPEVTAAGFEPLLKFAYTSKLLFDKDSALEIRNAASTLGFRDLDEACFDFLLPRFFSNNKDSVPFPIKTCCKKKHNRQQSEVDNSTGSDAAVLDVPGEKTVADSPIQQEVAQQCRKSVTSEMGSPKSLGVFAPVAEGGNDRFKQCPKYRKFQLACGKDACVMEKNLATGDRDDCQIFCKNNTELMLPSGNAGDKPWKTKEHVKNAEETAGSGDVCVLRKGRGDSEQSDVKKSSVKTEPVAEAEEDTAPGDRSPKLILHHCPLRALTTKSLGQDCLLTELEDEKESKQLGEEESETQLEKMLHSGREDGGRAGQKIFMNKETESMYDAGDAASELIVRDQVQGKSSHAACGQMQSVEMKLHVNVSTISSSSSSSGGGGGGGTAGGCPFLQNLDQSKCLWKVTGVSESEAASHSGVSSLNSGEDGESETETEGDSESNARDRAKQIQLPFSVDCIVNLSRNDFQQLLKQKDLTQEQLDFVHDMRRRSKNRLAARRCRKRKLDCIYNLQCEINKLKSERETLMMEKSHLDQLKQKTSDSVSTLCRRICIEANLQPEQLQVLAKYSGSDCPLSSFFPHLDALLSQPGVQLRPPSSLSAPGPDVSMSSSRTSAEESPHSL